MVAMFIWDSKSLVITWCVVICIISEWILPLNEPHADSYILIYNSWFTVNNVFRHWFRLLCVKNYKQAIESYKNNTKPEQTQHLATNRLAHIIKILYYHLMPLFYNYTATFYSRNYMIAFKSDSFTYSMSHDAALTFPLHWKWIG